MSAESPVRCRGYSAGSGSSSIPAVVTPQPVTDKSLFDSVAAVIHEVVPASYSTGTDSKEQVQWARFETADFAGVDLTGSLDSDSSSPPPLLLLLGYINGVQIWSIPATGEAVEVLSWRQGSVRVLRVLPTPLSDYTAVSSDLYAHKRPLIALCDTISPGPHFCSLGFISLKDGDQVKSIQFKNPILDVLANRSSVVVTFVERIAVFDAHTLEDRMTVTTCYPSTGLCPNPVALGTRWLAYAERMLVPMWRSKGGCEGEGVSSYTATMIHAAKSLGKGLRELGETVASSLTGAGMSHHAVSGVILGSETTQPGVVTILDIETTQENRFDPHAKKSVETVLAHFTAHSDPIVGLTFDPTGLLLLTADKRGHDFHLFRIHPHPCGSALAAVHHLYVLHRGDTTSKVQDVTFSRDSRWAAVSTSRGTTHVFPITPYGGPVGVRTHATPHVVNRLSRFHRSAGLTADGRSDSPVSSFETPCAVPYPNPRQPPFPHPIVVYPLAQIRRPTHVGPGISPQTSVKATAGRQRTLSSSEDAPNLKLCAAFAPPRAWLLEPRDSSRSKSRRSPIDSLFVASGHGSLIQYDLEPRHAVNTPREKVCDDTSIELFVEAKARWMLLRGPNSCEIQAPLSADSPLLDDRPKKSACVRRSDDEDRWLSQVEIMTHAGPHRRLWMGPQFMFKTYNGSLGVIPASESESIEVSVESRSRPARSNPVNMPLADGGIKPLVPVLIESTSASSYEQSPRLLEMHRNHHRRDSDSSTGAGELQLREDLADAMLESGAPQRDTGPSETRHAHLAQTKRPQPAIAKVVNPVGTVITLQSDDEYDGVVERNATLSESFIHENCDETLFRPIVDAKRTAERPTPRAPAPLRPAAAAVVVVDAAVAVVECSKKNQSDDPDPSVSRKKKRISDPPKRGLPETEMTLEYPNWIGPDAETDERMPDLKSLRAHDKDDRSVAPKASKTIGSATSLDAKYEPRTKKNSKPCDKVENSNKKVLKKTIAPTRNPDVTDKKKRSDDSNEFYDFSEADATFKNAAEPFGTAVVDPEPRTVDVTMSYGESKRAPKKTAARSAEYKKAVIDIDRLSDMFEPELPSVVYETKQKEIDACKAAVTKPVDVRFDQPVSLVSVSDESEPKTRSYGFGPKKRADVQMLTDFESDFKSAYGRVAEKSKTRGGDVGSIKPPECESVPKRSDERKRREKCLDEKTDGENGVDTFNGKRPVLETSEMVCKKDEDGAADFEKNIKDDHFEREVPVERPCAELTKIWSEVTVGKAALKSESKSRKASNETSFGASSDVAEKRPLKWSDIAGKKSTPPDKDGPTGVAAQPDKKSPPKFFDEKYSSYDLKLKPKKGKKTKQSKTSGETQRKPADDDDMQFACVDHEPETLDVTMENFSAVDFVCDDVDDDIVDVAATEFVEAGDQESDEPFLSLETDMPELEPLLGGDDPLGDDPLGDEPFAARAADGPGADDATNNATTSSSQTESDDSCKNVEADSGIEVVVAPLESAEQVDKTKSAKKKPKKKRR